MRISVVICTYNRCKSLKRTLESLARLTVPPELTWEVVIVDNNSTDDTWQTAECFARSTRVPVWYVFERQTGLSHARNAGITRASGEVVSFIDDDVAVDENWLTEIRNAFERFDVACVGGRVLIPPDFKIPKWWHPAYDWPLGKFDLGDQVLFKPEIVGIGANISFRRAVFDKYGYFLPQLGRKGRALSLGEETELVSRLLECNETAIYYPQCRVYHYPSHTRLTRGYIRRWSYRLGEWQWYEGSKGRPPAITWMGIPRWLFRSIPETCLRLLWNAALLRKPRAVKCEMTLCCQLGQLAAAVAERRALSAQLSKPAPGL